MTLRKIFLKLALFVGLTLSGLAGQASATPFSESFESVANPAGASSFTFTVSGVSFTASLSSGGNDRYTNGLTPLRHQLYDGIWCRA